MQVYIHPIHRNLLITLSCLVIVSTTACSTTLPLVNPGDPYPYQLPKPTWSPEALDTWGHLQHPVSVIWNNLTVRDSLSNLAEKLKVDVVFHDGISSSPLSEGWSPGIISGLGVDVLSRCFAWLPLDCDITSDGRLLIASNQNISRHGLMSIRHHLRRSDEVTRRLDGGWDGLALEGEAGRARMVTTLQAKQVSVSWKRMPLSACVDHLREISGINIHVDHGADHDLATLPDFEPETTASVEALVDAICSSADIGYVVEEDLIVFKGIEEATEVNARRERELTIRNDARRQLSRPLRFADRASANSLVQLLSNTTGLEVVPSEDVWNSRIAVRTNRRMTAHDLLNRLGIMGIRWGLLDGRLYLVR